MFVLGSPPYEIILITPGIFLFLFSAMNKGGKGFVFRNPALSFPFLSCSRYLAASISMLTTTLILGMDRQKTHSFSFTF